MFAAYKARDVPLSSVGRSLLNIARVTLRNETARRLTLYPVFSAVSRKREAGISNRVRAKRLSRLLPSAGTCTSISSERVGGPEVSWEQRDEEQVSRSLRVVCPVHPLGIVARARCDGRFRHAGVLERDG